MFSVYNLDLSDSIQNSSQFFLNLIFFQAKQIFDSKIFWIKIQFEPNFLVPEIIWI